MVLVDTSVWIHFLRGNSSYASPLKNLLANEEVGGHELVFGELLIGDRGGRHEFLVNYGAMPSVDPASHREVVQFVRSHKLHGRGAGWIDVHLLAAALIGKVRFWTADERLATLAEELGVAYSPKL